MATVYCCDCTHSYTKGGVTYCGCPGCPYKDKSVSPNSGKNCNYFKSWKER